MTRRLRKVGTDSGDGCPTLKTESAPAPSRVVQQDPGSSLSYGHNADTPPAHGTHEDA